MNKHAILSSIALLISLGVRGQHKEYMGKMQVTPLSLEQRGDSIYIDLRFDISGVNVDARRSISLIPSLVAPRKKFDLPAVVVKGRQNYNVHRRQWALMSPRQRSAYARTAPYAVVEGFKSNRPKTIHYTTAIRYQPWMAEAKLDMYEDLCGCGNPPRRMGVSQLVNWVALEQIQHGEAYAFTPYVAYVEPITEPTKHRASQVEAFLDFAVNRTEIRPDYRNNPTELSKITDLIGELNNDRTIRIKSINVIGYASPEGTLAGNERLSEGRAKALVDYLTPRFSYPKSLYRITFGGENWEGLKECVAASTMPYRDQVLEIIETVPAAINYATNTSRKKSLMDLQAGVPYFYMLQQFFPSLRKAVCSIDFEVSHFDIAQAKEVLKTRPGNLSLNELFLVAGSYEKGSPEFIDLFETAARLFPNDVTANLNAASAALARKDEVAAQRYLQQIAGQIQTPEYYNAAGVLAMLQGDYAQAEIALTQAVEAGSVEAKQNLGQLTQKRDRPTPNKTNRNN